VLFALLPPQTEYTLDEIRATLRNKSAAFNELNSKKARSKLKMLESHIRSHRHPLLAGGEELPQPPTSTGAVPSNDGICPVLEAALPAEPTDLFHNHQDMRLVELNNQPLQYIHHLNG
jgi:hypothetical protein